MPKKEPIPRGPKGGRKHRPGRGHAAKSDLEKKNKFKKRRSRRKEEQEELASQAWAEWDSKSDELKNLLGPSAAPKMPRPKDE